MHTSSSNVCPTFFISPDFIEKQKYLQAVCSGNSPVSCLCGVIVSHAEFAVFGLSDTFATPVSYILVRLTDYVVCDRYMCNTSVSVYY